MDKKDFIANYEAPLVEVLEVNVEQGFASSGEPGEWGDGLM